MDGLNKKCYHFSLDRDALSKALDDAQSGVPGLAEWIFEHCPTIFADQPVFVAEKQVARIAQVVQAIESIVAMPAYRTHVLASAPAIARIDPGGPRGVFFGYDFHLSDGRLSLIEINTNAGGAMINTALARAQRSCCSAMDEMLPDGASIDDFERQIIDMFRREWRLADHDRPLGTIAIVDEAPEQQYLFPEFLLFQRLFERNGIKAVICSPADLRWGEGRLWHGTTPVDLVYNRLTDFYLEQPACAALRSAYEQHAIALSPHPQAHALYAQKRLLALFSDDGELQSLGVPDATRELLLQSVPRTEVVVSTEGERLWAHRRELFFKPLAGYGGRAAYRGDKLTRRVWQEILAGGYVAQEFAPPGERCIEDEGTPRTMKYDIRSYVYNGNVQWLAARLYQGQTTNFRTKGGGFASVLHKDIRRKEPVPVS